MVHVIRIGPNEYIHVLDTNSNVTRLVEGPQTYTRKEHERIKAGPLDKITLPTNYYCTVHNPVKRNDSNEVIYDDIGMATLSHGEQEIRLASQYPEPFVLYPGEIIESDPEELPTVAPNTALRLRATRPIFENEELKYPAGAEWLFHGWFRTVTA